MARRKDARLRLAVEDLFMAWKQEQLRIQAENKAKREKQEEEQRQREKEEQEQLKREEEVRRANELLIEAQRQQHTQEEQEALRVRSRWNRVSHPEPLSCRGRSSG